MEGAIENSKEGVAAWIEVAIDEGQFVPAPGKIGDHVNSLEFKWWFWAVVEVDGLLIDDEKERVNISLPKRVLAELNRLQWFKAENRSEL